jgi:signal peptidase I
MNIRKFKWILAFAGAVVVVLLLRGFAFTSCLIPSTGMENSIFQGERILVNKWSYGLRVPFMSLFSYHRWCESPVRQQDIVVFNNPAGIREPIIDRREIYISRCLGVPGDTLLVDSLFSVISPEAQFNPDKKRLYSYPASKENLITSLMHTLSITNDGLMGSNDSTHVRSFSRYDIIKELFLLCSGRLFHRSEETVPSVSVKQACLFFFGEPNDGGFPDDMVLRDKPEEP